MEKIQECAGNLKAELYNARDEYDHGRMTQEAFLARVDVLRSKARNVRQKHCKPRPQVSAVLPGFESYATAWKSNLPPEITNEEPSQERHEVWAASYL